MTYATMFKSGGNSENLRSTFNDLRTFVLAALTGSTCLTSPALKIGTSSKKAVRNNSAFSFTDDGVTETKAAAETAFTATTHDVASDKEAIFVLSIATGGTITITKGDDAEIGQAVAPDTPTGEAKIGEVKIATSGDTFDATTDDLDATWLTVTYTNWDYDSVNTANGTPGFQLTAS
jgi:hypothetical protein